MSIHWGESRYVIGDETGANPLVDRAAIQPIAMFRFRAIQPITATVLGIHHRPARWFLKVPGGRPFRESSARLGYLSISGDSTIARLYIDGQGR